MNSTDAAMSAAKFILYTSYGDRDRASECGSSHETPFTWTETFSWATFSTTAQSYWATSETETNSPIAFDSAEKNFESLDLGALVIELMVTSVELGEKVVYVMDYFLSMQPYL
jgi:hypothetical protein